MIHFLYLSTNSLLVRWIILEPVFNANPFAIRIREIELIEPFPVNDVNNYFEANPDNIYIFISE